MSKLDRDTKAIVVYAVLLFVLFIALIVVGYYCVSIMSIIARIFQDAKNLH